MLGWFPSIFKSLAVSIFKTKRLSSSLAQWNVSKMYLFDVLFVICRSLCVYRCNEQEASESMGTQPEDGDIY
jgi:hypothetical protein